MRHHKQLNYDFVNPPIDFNKYTDKDILQYCLGATLYMPATRNLAKVIFENKWPELTTMVWCFEDAIDIKDVPFAEDNVIKTLDIINQSIKDDNFEYENLPLIILRVRNLEQFKSFTKRLNCDHLKLLTGFNFPKFSSDDGIDYFSHLESLIISHNEILYGMPILETKNIAYKESRYEEMDKIKSILDQYNHLVLNVRVGATDFSSYFGLRRGIDFGIYEIMIVRDILSDVLNFFTRSDKNYVISAPVWEFFSMNKEMKFESIDTKHLTNSLLTRQLIVDEAIDGLLREIIIDKANGFSGKTVIHPTHVKYVNIMHMVIKEEYEDALQILNTSGGVVKSSNNNKMNEINPHKSWAAKTIARAKVYGVINDQSCYKDLFDWNKEG